MSSGLQGLCLRSQVLPHLPIFGGSVIVTIRCIVIASNDSVSCTNQYYPHVWIKMFSLNFSWFCKHNHCPCHHSLVFLLTNEYSASKMKTIYSAWNNQWQLINALRSFNKRKFLLLNPFMFIHLHTCPYYVKKGVPKWLDIKKNHPHVLLKYMFLIPGTRVSVGWRLGGLIAEPPKITQIREYL